jgi:hypothetical protein
MALQNECRHGVPAGGSCLGCEYDEQERELLSSCCGVTFYEDTDICTNCKEHG